MNNKSTHPIIRLLKKTRLCEYSDCWLWEGARNWDNYGMIKVRTKKITSTHIISFNFFKGNIPKGKQINHICMVRNCVNPEHLELVTAKQNQQSSFGKRYIECKDNIDGHYFKSIVKLIK